VAVLAPRERLAGEDGGNLVLVASDEPLDLDALRTRAARRGDERAVTDAAQTAAFAGDAQVLTDDDAPVDQLLTPYVYASD
jgi:hypothetical protein